MFSPHSIRSALYMVKEGAVDETLAELTQFIGDVIETVNVPTFDSVNAVFHKIDVNTVWRKKIKHDVDADTYHITSNVIPVSIVNEWVNVKTKGKIPKMLEQGQVDKDILMILANAVYFKDKWAHEFETENTKPLPFYLSDGTTIEADTMYQFASDNDLIGYVETKTHKAIKLPYKDPSLEMIVILPLDKLTGTITTEDVDKVLSSNFSIFTDVRIWLPKFETRWGGSIKQYLIDMGITRSFSDLAQFYGMVTRPQDFVKIDDIIHKSFIKVDEEGTEAVAATVITARCLAASANFTPPKIFKANRQFTYVIREKQYHKPSTVLFVGSIFNPND